MPQGIKEQSATAGRTIQAGPPSSSVPGFYPGIGAGCRARAISRTNSSPLAVFRDRSQDGDPPPAELLEDQPGKAECYTRNTH